MLKSLPSAISLTQNAPEELLRTDQTKFHPEALTIIIFVALQLEKVGPTFQGAVSRNSAKLGNYKMLVKLSETQK